MSLTLEQAEIVAGSYVEGGQCQNASIVPLKINESAARLLDMGDWTGTVRRYGITLDDNGCFTLPTEAADIRRISILGEDLPHSPAGTMFMSGGEAFVFDSSGVLPQRQVGPGKFKIIGSRPTAVDVMVKIKATQAKLPTDELCIDDAYAIKLAVQALFYEESQQLEMSAQMWNLAKAHLQSKTDNTISASRRVKFTTILSGAAQNTMGYARAKFALATTKGLAVDDHETVALINDAEEVLIPLLSLHEEGLFKTRSGIFALPPQYSSIYRLTINNCPVTLRSNWFEYIQSGLGYRESTRKASRGESVIARGEHALHTDMPGPSSLLLLPFGNERGVKVRVTGVGAGGSHLTEELTLNAGDQVETKNTYYDVTSITKDPSDGDVSIVAGSVEVAYLYSWQQDSTVKRYFIPSCNDCVEQIVRVVAKPRFYPKVSDYDKLQCPYPYAVSCMAQGIYAQRQGQPEVANALKAEAISHIETAMANEKIGEANQIDIQSKGWGFGGLASRR
jgi:hypothetical protein